MKKALVISASLLVILVPLIASAHGGHGGHHGHRGGSSDQPVSSPSTPTPPVPKPVPPPTPPIVPTLPVGSVSEIGFLTYTTSFAALDNTPKGSTIQYDGSNAGGTGTYADPISLASGYVLQNGNPVFDYAPGTKFYLPNLEKYFVVSDECGDNPSKPEPCHNSEMPPYPQLDLWAGSSLSNGVLACEDAITGVHLIIENPASTYKVIPGAIYGISCATQYGDVIVSE